MEVQSGRERPRTRLDQGRVTWPCDMPSNLYPSGFDSPPARILQIRNDRCAHWAVALRRGLQTCRHDVFPATRLQGRDLRRVPAVASWVEQKGRREQQTGIDRFKRAQEIQLWSLQIRNERMGTAQISFSSTSITSGLDIISFLPLSCARNKYFL